MASGWRAMMPLYGFLDGDTIGLLVLAQTSDTMADLIQKLQSMAAVRVAPRPSLVVRFAGRVVPPELTVSRAGMQPLDRFDVGPP